MRKVAGDDRVKLLHSVGHFEGRPSMIGLGEVMLPRMGLRGEVRFYLIARVMVTGTTEDYDERKRNVAQLLG